MEKFQELRGYKVEKVPGHGDDWRVTFYIGREEVGHACLQTAEQADDAGVDFMFGDTP